MTVGPAEAAKLIAQKLSVDAEPRPLREILIQVIISEGWYVSLEAADKADEWLARVKSRIGYLISKTLDDGGFLSFQFNSSGDDYLQGSCYCEPHEPHEVKQAKTKRAATYEVYRCFAALSADQFEQLSGKILTLLSVDEAFVSRRSADQGVDFFGRVAIGKMLKPSLLNMGPEKHMFVWIIGQAKHYLTTKVGTAEIRELIGSIELARAKIFVGRGDPLVDLEVRLCDPIIYMFFTSGTFTKDSKQLMARSGVLAFEGLQLAQFIADHGIGLSQASFSEQAFNLWLSS